MKILLITWQQGENNPFDYFNSQLKKQFELIGCIVSMIDLDDNFISNLNSHSKADVAITWQGLGSNINTDEGVNLWEKMKTQLVCLHGDHPCHMPFNHEVDNAYVHHIYAAPSFARYANTYFNKSHPAIYYLFPNIFSPRNIKVERTGNFFVFPKNLDPITEIFNTWKINLRPKTSQFLIEAADIIISDYELNLFKDHHSTIDELITREKFDQLLIENDVTNEASLFHELHSLLDKVYRNYASEQVINLLQNYPVKIYGRGWDSFKERNNSKHEYFEFDSVANGDFQFDSNYGIIDIAPSIDSLHDRLFRAISRGGAFISNSLLSHTSLIDKEFDNLFYRIDNNNLQETAEKIMTSPKEHLDACETFSISYNQKNSFYNFYLYLVSLTR